MVFCAYQKATSSYPSINSSTYKWIYMSMIGKPDAQQLTGRQLTKIQFIEAKVTDIPTNWQWQITDSMTSQHTNELVLSVSWWEMLNKDS